MSEGGLGKSALLLYSITAVITLFLLVPLLFPIALSFSDRHSSCSRAGLHAQCTGRLQRAGLHHAVPVQRAARLFSAIGALILGTPTAMGTGAL